MGNRIRWDYFPALLIVCAIQAIEKKASPPDDNYSSHLRIETLREPAKMARKQSLKSAGAPVENRLPTHIGAASSTLLCLTIIPRICHWTVRGID